MSFDDVIVEKPLCPILDELRMIGASRAASAVRPLPAIRIARRYARLVGVKARLAPRCEVAAHERRLEALPGEIGAPLPLGTFGLPFALAIERDFSSRNSQRRRA